MVNVKKATVNKNSVDIVLSIDKNDFTGTRQALKMLIDIAIENGASENIRKQVFDANGNVKINKTHTFY